MADELVMPRLSDTMERGTIARWVVKEGDAFKNGDVLAEIETDKALMELSAYDDGVLLKILVPDGGEAELGAPIAVTGEAGEEVPAEMLAIISTLRAMTYASIGLVLMLLCQLFFSGHLLYWTVLLLPLWIVAFLAFLIGITWLLSAMGAFTRDTAYLMMTLAPVLMFATPVFWSHETLSPNMKLLMYANVMTGYIEVIRDIVVFGQVPNPWVAAWTAFVSMFFFWFGYWFFRRQQDAIADVI